MISVVLLATLVSGLAARPESILCIDGACHPSRGTRPAVSASHELRTFVWISHDSTRVVAGTIPAEASSVSLDDDVLAANKLQLATSDGMAGIEVGYELRCGSTWKWTLRSGGRSGLEIRHPPEKCSLILNAEGYRGIEQPLSRPDLGRVDLIRLPVVSGTITDATTRTPIVAAEVFLPDGEMLAVSEVTGRFRAAVKGPWPVWLRVEAPGRASRTVHLPRAVTDTDLPITMSAGGSVAVTIEPPLGEEALTWEIRQSERKTSPEDRLVRSGKTPAGTTEFNIDALEAGQYRLVIKGQGPLQRFGVPVAVTDAMIAEASVRITPAVIDVQVLLDDSPLDDASVELSFGRNTWRASVTADADGRIHEEIWQRGSYTAAVSSPPLVPYWSDARNIDADGTTQWTIRIAERKLQGHVLDERSREPLGDALIMLEWKSAAAGSGMITQHSAADGTFEFTALPVGTYSLQATKDGYQSLTTPPSGLTEDVRAETRDLFLRRVVGSSLRVINSHDVPMSAAVVFVANREGVREAGRTDERGQLVLPVRDGDSATIFVLPRSGSFAFARLADLMSPGEGQLVIRVPDPMASLEVVAESSEGGTVSPISVMLRVDGVLIPIAVREAMTSYQGVPLMTDAQGRMLFPHLPTGRYEIWPLASRDDLLAVMASSPPPAPIHVMLTPGHHTARLKFRAKP